MDDEGGPHLPDDGRVHLVAVLPEALTEPRARHAVALAAGLGVLDVRDLVEADLPVVVSREISRARARELAEGLARTADGLPAVVLDARSDARALLANLGGFGFSLLGLATLAVSATWALLFSDTSGWPFASAIAGVVLVVAGMATAWGASRSSGHHRASVTEALQRRLDAQTRAGHHAEAWTALQAARKASLASDLPPSAAADLWTALEGVEASWRTGSPQAADVAGLVALERSSDAGASAAVDRLRRATLAAASVRRELDGT